MEKLHSNVYQLNENWLLGKIYNRLGILDGHFTLIFKKDNTEFKIYKHGGYSNTNPQAHRYNIPASHWQARRWQHVVR